MGRVIKDGILAYMQGLCQGIGMKGMANLSAAFNATPLQQNSGFGISVVGGENSIQRHSGFGISVVGGENSIQRPSGLDTKVIGGEFSTWGCSPLKIRLIP